MENKVMLENPKDGAVTEIGIYSKGGFIQKKHSRAMCVAQELLCKAATSCTTIYDSLNCGKLGRLITYLKGGNAVTLLWVSCYLEYVAA
jgi:hypothetical protein